MLALLLVIPQISSNKTASCPAYIEKIIYGVNPTQIDNSSSIYNEHLQSLNHEKKLALDANTTYDPDVSGYQCRLNYHAGKPTINKQHDGKLGTLVATCGLQDPLALQHPDRLFPASHICGTNYIIVSPNLMPALCQSGSLAFHYLMLSDHRAHYVDFDALHLFFDPAYPIAPPSHR
jgi:hypothetical protein